MPSVTLAPRSREVFANVCWLNGSREGCGFRLSWKRNIAPSVLSVIHLFEMTESESSFAHQHQCLQTRGILHTNVAYLSCRLPCRFETQLSQTSQRNSSAYDGPRSLPMLASRY